MIRTLEKRFFSQTNDLITKNLDQMRASELYFLVALVMLINIILASMLINIIVDYQCSELTYTAVVCDHPHETF